ncbi:S8 family serine peptidase [Streptosporangium sandarakinum]|uniref:S8 family serine peptidase n=1 Tax=Streptosporangium sandarakinum TaxID=1260955 RepID=UPI00342B4F97
MKRVIVIAAAALAAAALAVPAQARRPDAAPGKGPGNRYVVLYRGGVSAADARRAVLAAGGAVVRENAAVGVATVTAASPGFAGALLADPRIEGVARDVVIGRVPRRTGPEGAGREGRAGTGGTGGLLSAAVSAVPRAASAHAGAVRAASVHGAGETGAGEAGSGEAGSGEARRAAARGDEPDLADSGASALRPEPLAGRQWDMRQIHATVTGSYRRSRGTHDVLVGVLDTGVDAGHPDIAANYNFTLSRNFTVDVPADANGKDLDGPCEQEPDKSCTDPVTVDENGHGTHVASSIASPINGLGIAGVAPGASIVSLRVGQDSGYFFLQPTVDALTYAADNGVDVVNMSYYVDPWLFNCTDNPADTPEERQEQRTVITAVQRALDYAHDRNVTLVSAVGNGASDYTRQVLDTASPDFARVAGQRSRNRLISPSCLSMPSEGDHVIAISATGISGRKAYYSDYGDGYVHFAAPGGDVYDTPGRTQNITRATLAAYPRAVAEKQGELAPDGSPRVDDVVRSCRGRVCGYYEYLQGTSMASPRAAGVAALIVSRYGVPDPVHGGKTLSPDVVERRLRTTATRRPCPVPAAYTYVRRLIGGGELTTTQECEGTSIRNGFFGYGVVDALRAVG